MVNYVATTLMNLASACIGIGISLLVTTDPRFQTGHVYALLALLFAVSSVGTGLVAYCLARLSDRLGRRPMILLSVTGTIGTSLLLGIVASWGQLFLVLTFLACFLGMYWPSLEARITDGADGRELTRRLGIFGIVVSVGLFLGPVTGGLLSDLQVRAPFYAAALCTAFLLVLFAVAFSREDTHDGHQSTPPSEADLDLIRVEPSVRRAFLVSAWTANAAISAAAPILRGMFPRFAKLPTAGGGLGLSGGEAGAVVAAIGVSMLLVFIVLGRYHFWHYRFRYLLPSQVVSVVGCLLFAVYSTGPILLAGALLFGVGSGVAYFSSIYYSLHEHTARAGQSGRHEAFLCFGFSGGMAATAALMGYAPSHRMPYWICVAILLGGIAAQVSIVARSRMKDISAVRPWGTGLLPILKRIVFSQHRTRARFRRKHRESNSARTTRRSA